MGKKKNIKICLVASAGGHLTQLLKLTDSWQQYEAIYVSTVDVVTQKLRQLGRTYIVGECNRQHPFKTLKVLFRCLWLVFKERPDVVISTGAAPGFLLSIIAKLFGAKVVWLDSVANTKKLSVSGRIIRPFADLILSQWPDVADKYKNVEYAGAVI